MKGDTSINGSLHEEVGHPGPKLWDKRWVDGDDGYCNPPITQRRPNLRPEESGTHDHSRRHSWKPALDRLDVVDCPHDKLADLTRLSEVTCASARTDHELVEPHHFATGKVELGATHI